MWDGDPDGDGGREDDDEKGDEGMATASAGARAGGRSPGLRGPALALRARAPGRRVGGGELEAPGPGPTPGRLGEAGHAEAWTPFPGARLPVRGPRRRPRHAARPR